MKSSAVSMADGTCLWLSGFIGGGQTATWLQVQYHDERLQTLDWGI